MKAAKPVCAIARSESSKPGEVVSNTGKGLKFEEIICGGVVCHAAAIFYGGNIMSREQFMGDLAYIKARSILTGLLGRGLITQEQFTAADRLNALECGAKIVAIY